MFCVLIKKKMGWQKGIAFQTPIQLPFVFQNAKCMWHDYFTFTLFIEIYVGNTMVAVDWRVCVILLFTLLRWCVYPYDQSCQICWIRVDVRKYWAYNHVLTLWHRVRGRTTCYHRKIASMIRYHQASSYNLTPLASIQTILNNLLLPELNKHPVKKGGYNSETRDRAFWVGMSAL